MENSEITKEVKEYTLDKMEVEKIILKHYDIIPTNYCKCAFNWEIPNDGEFNISGVSLITERVIVEKMIT